MDQLLAAVDLGSNSFRLYIGRIVQQDGTPQIYQIDRLKAPCLLYTSPVFASQTAWRILDALVGVAMLAIAVKLLWP